MARCADGCNGACCLSYVHFYSRHTRYHSPAAALQSQLARSSLFLSVSAPSIASNRISISLVPVQIQTLTLVSAEVLDGSWSGSGAAFCSPKRYFWPYTLCVSIGESRVSMPKHRPTRSCSTIPAGRLCTYAPSNGLSRRLARKMLVYPPAGV
jgi:hypothetical protein